MKPSADSPDLAAVRSAAARWRSFAGQSAKWFPAGTGPDVGKTGAKAEIWQKPEDFSAKMRDFQGAAKALNAAAAKGDVAAIKAALRRPRQDLQGVPRHLPLGDETLSSPAGREAADLGPADPAVPLAARRPDRLQLVVGGRTSELDLHIWSGIAVLTLLIFRLLWGLFGSSTARFANFVRGPRPSSPICGTAGSWRSAGHTPLGALSVVALLGSDRTAGRPRPVLDRRRRLLRRAARPLDQPRAIRRRPRPARGAVQRPPRLHRPARRRDPLLPAGRGKKLIRADDHRPGRRSSPASQPMRRGRWWVALLCLAVAIAVTRWIVAGAPPFGA